MQLGYIARSIRGCPPRLLPGRMRHRRPHIISLDKGSDIGSLRDDKASPDPSEAGLSRACRHGRAESQNEATGRAWDISELFNAQSNMGNQILPREFPIRAPTIRAQTVVGTTGGKGVVSVWERHTALRHRHTHLTSPGFPRGGPERPLLNLWLDKPAQAEKAPCCQSKVRTSKSGPKVYGWRTSIEFCGWRLNF
ncbi:unnamed protein product [Fusarium graminearum]|nr:unnamed protein product [Fusarium graminearum]